MSTFFLTPEMSSREELFDTEVQTEMMMNISDDPPFLRIGGATISSDEILTPGGVMTPSAIGRWLDE